MRTTFALALIVASSAACGGKSGSAKLEGHWRGVRAEGVEPIAANNALAFATQTEIYAKGNQITIRTPGSSSSGTYTVDSEEKTQVVVHTDHEPTETFTFIDANTMSWRIDPNRSITFQRVRE